MVIAGDELERTGRGVIDLLIEQWAIPGRAAGGDHRRMASEAVGARRGLVIPVTALGDKPRASAASRSETFSSLAASRSSLAAWHCRRTPPSYHTARHRSPPTAPGTP
jgi:hypothetical protein